MPTNWKTEYNKAIRGKKFAWAKFFEANNELFELSSSIYNNVNQEIPQASSNPDDITLEDIKSSDFLQEFIKELYKKAKASCECPICMEQIKPEDLLTTNCGHNYHKSCMEAFKEHDTSSKSYVNCPTCRAKVFK
jgi:hypothetical protein